MTVKSEDYGWQRASINGIVSDVDGNIFPIQGNYGQGKEGKESYINGQGNYAGTEQRNVSPIACFKHGAPEEPQLEQPVPSPSRRSSSSNSDRNIDFNSQPSSQHEINFKSTYSEEPLPPQLINSEDSLPDNQVFLQRTPTSNENFVDDIIIESIPETTTPAIETQSNQEIVLSKQLQLEEQKKYNFDRDLKNQFISQSSVGADSPNLNLRTECANKNKIESMIMSPRRFLKKITYDVSSQKKILEKNNDLLHSITVPLHENNTIILKNNEVVNENVDGSINNKLPVYKLNIFKVQDTEKPLQQPNENMTVQADYRHYTYNNVIPQVKDPTKGKGITYINKKTKLNLMDIGRVCYACSTENNPTCWAPDRRTTVKYCRKSDNACVTKTFGSESKL